ncbi:MAG: tetratricopeptide repeat protein [candidate division KSB1 bacterium]|nr:tetratricopeptide repeat protein [candidate division KSB1 bacterium]
MKCTNPRMKKWVNLYQLDLLPEEQKISVEAHLLECEACFQELYRFSPVLEALEEMPERFLDALQPRETLLAQAIRFLKGQVADLKRISALIFSALVRWWEKPAVKVLVPVTVAALVAMIVLLPEIINLFQPPPHYSDLAVIEKAIYKPLSFRGPVEPQKLFDEGMRLYEQDNYVEAIPKLAAFLEHEPHDAYGHFYLGVCWLLQGDIRSAIEHLDLASELSQEQSNKLLLEKCYWYLGNAYLKINDVENALIEFRKVVELGEELGEEARKQISRIEERKK